ncbi:hypothetical protein Taro_008547 [Colocasia esculenta]|uniref:Uncharacterized protein n=1 Tax=Colocasia esculenta TaxID=4460 RepID=A0A843U1F0_COLES|nr:hypothetical protein [Colocasia esculenta]
MRGTMNVITRLARTKVQNLGDRDRIGRPKTDPTRRSRARLGRAGPSPTGRRVYVREPE